MPPKVQPTAKSLAKRGTPSAWPHELKLITEKSDPLYDKRVFNSVDDVAIRNMVLVKQIQPVAIRMRGDDMVVAAGRGRVKRITIINHLSGAHPYKGTLYPILEAIQRLKGSELETLCADRCPHGMKVQYVLNRGTEKEGTGAMASENTMRDDYTLDDKIRTVHTLSAQGFSADEIISNGYVKGKSVATIKRWLKTDPDAIKPLSKTKSKSGPSRPTMKRIEKVMTAGEAVFSVTEAALLDWFSGGKDSDLIKHFPLLKETLGG
jgi:hypothetical protein